jgi:alkylhydroperoxidase family enzyme
MSSATAAPIPPAIEAIPWEAPLFPEVKDDELWAYERARSGRNAYAAFLSPCPWLLRGMADIGALTRQVVYAPEELVHVVALVTAQENSCRHCYGAQRAVLKVLGYDERQIRDLERDVQLATGVTRATVDFARKLSRSNPRPARLEREALVAAGLSQEAVAELAFYVGMNCFNNRVATLLSAPVAVELEELAERWWMPLVRPFLKRSFRFKRGVPLTGATAEGPLQPVFAHLTGIPGAMRLQQMMAECLASPAIPLRSRLLMTATVARALGCPVCQTESRAALVAEGLSEAALDQILGTLGSDALTPLERELLPFARATVRYEPAAIQKKTRELIAATSSATALEAIGTAALANTAVRLAMLTQ